MDRSETCRWTIDHLEQFQVSTVTGFLPEECLLEQLPAFYNDWERTCRELPNLQATGKLQGIVERIPVLATSNLKTLAEWRRAYVILGFIANAYLWGGNCPQHKLPMSIAVPFLSVAHYMSMPPVPTYAAENLWNFRLIDQNASACDPDNIRALSSFTKSIDEEWFFALPTAIEARGAPLISLALASFDAVSKNDSSALVDRLQGMTGHIQALASLLPRMYEKCDPHYFYCQVRPFLAGTTSAELPNGILFETGDGVGSFQKFKGPTAAQSPLFHFLDIALGVVHRPTGIVQDSSSPPDSPHVGDPFLTEMREYMSQPHRRFLAHVTKLANIRQFVQSHQQEENVSEAYNDCLAALTLYRNKHVQLVTKYIVIPSRAAARTNLPEAEPGTAGRIPVSNDTSTSDHSVNDSVALGTGGTAPVEFLKQVRNETKASTI